MHIEITDCQGNIPTLKKTAPGKRARQKTSRPMKLPNDSTESESSGVLVQREIGKTNGLSPAKLAPKSPQVEGKILTDGASRLTTNFRENSHEKKHFSDISLAKNCFR
ncbi:hypothetical protein ACFZAC_03215 [Pseudomonas fluorescens]|jgi:hypothetical protein|uniref:hypothetical protein n=1 Tax=Pseudomonas fluorescens TaxID=294 RepID=UPI003749213D